MPQGGSSTGRGGQAEPPKPAESHKSHISQGEGALIELPPPAYDFETDFLEDELAGALKTPETLRKYPRSPPVRADGSAQRCPPGQNPYGTPPAEPMEVGDKTSPGQGRGGIWM